MLSSLDQKAVSMQEMDMYEEILERKITNMEKRMKWLQRDLWLFREIVKRNATPKKEMHQKRVLQLDMFVG